ncbi:uncharacterized protein LOC144944707 [Lampetra fluviatilis]
MEHVMEEWFNGECTLQEYNLQIEYRAGRTHANADALSRRPTVDAETRAEEACPCFTGGRCRQATDPRAAAATDPPPARESAVCATEALTGGTEDPVDRTASAGPAARDPIGRIQEDVGCAFPGLNDEQLRQTQQRDPDLAAVEAALREEKSALPGPWSAATGGREPPRGALAGDPPRGQGPSLPARRGRAPAARAGRPTPYGAPLLQCGLRVRRGG